MQFNVHDSKILTEQNVAKRFIFEVFFGTNFKDFVEGFCTYTESTKF